LNSPIVYAVILAAGSSSRMQTDVKKQRLTLDGVSVLKRSVLIFDSIEAITGIYVICREEDVDFAKKECQTISKPVSFVIGGDSRQESAKNGFLALPKNAEFVAFHDAARCLVTTEDVLSCLKAAEKFGAASLVGPVTDTVKVVENGVFLQTLDRDSLRLAQTPQIFHADWYREAIEYSEKNRLIVTDDNAMVEALGKKVYAVESTGKNLKITTKADLLLAEALLKVRRI